MQLQGQGAERGYAMAALLVSIAVMSVLMSVALPAWRHEAQREKEAELVFRGEQYARAVALFRVKNGNAFPPSVDVLVQGRYLRKKYLDPITQQDFDVIGVGAQSPQGGAPAGRGTAPQPPPSSATASAVTAGIMGVHSKSKETSIRVYQGQTKYDQWNFVFTAVNRPGGNTPQGAEQPGVGGRGAPMPGGRQTLPGRGGAGRGGTGPGRGTGGGRGDTFSAPPPPGRGGNPGGQQLPRGPGGR